LANNKSFEALTSKPIFSNKAEEKAAPFQPTPEVSFN
jgi:hypothetical protein